MYINCIPCYILLTDIPDLMNSVKNNSNKDGEGGGASGSGEGGENGKMEVDKSPSKKGTPSKRKRKQDPEEVSDEDTPPSKKQRKPVCKYGAKCYQTNSKHREEFDHPWVSSLSPLIF